MDERYNQIISKSGFESKQYQYDGIKWCIRNELDNIHNIRGGLIADEMGLGKTIQIIALMYINFLPRTLIILPPILVQQWYDEIYKCTGHKSTVYYGRKKHLISTNTLQTSPIIITTYNTILPNKNRISPLTKYKWNRVIFDEAHHLRNHKSKSFIMAQQLKSSIKWFVTGTPIQNKRNDLYNLLSLIGLQSKFYKDTNNNYIINKHFILRRTKASVGILIPPIQKIDHIVQWENIHEQRLSEEIHSLVSTSYVSENRGRLLSQVISKQGHLLSLLRARQTCILPLLIKPTIQKAILNDAIVDSKYNSNYTEAINHSSKINAVINLILQRKDNMNGKIVFCHYIGEIDIIAQRLLDGGITDIIKYDGRMTNKHMCNFKTSVIIMQIQTGSEGINLQHHFNEIYFVSPHWNPCVEDQAIARCHRIGQVKTVYVFKFEMGGFLKNNYLDKQPISMETYVNHIQQMKRDISNSILTQ